MPTQRLEGKRVEERVGEGEGEKEHTHVGERERKCFGSSFYMFFFLHLSLPYANWAYPGVLFVLPEVFTLVLGPSFDLPCFLATAILDSFSLFYYLTQLFHPLSFPVPPTFNLSQHQGLFK